MLARGGRELFYRRDGQLIAVDVITNDRIAFGRPKVLFEGPYGPEFDVSPDGSRFLMLEQRSADDPTQIDVVLNWFEELKQRVPLR